MSDWQPGDLALCVRHLAQDHMPTVAPVRVGAVYTVTKVSAGRDVYGRVGVALTLDRDNHRVLNWAGYNAAAFHKIRPHTPDAEDAETIRLLTGKPVPEPAQ